MRFGPGVQLILIYSLILFGYLRTTGFYSFGGFVSIVIAYFLLFFINFSKKDDPKELKIALNLLFFISLVLSLIFYRILYEEKEVLGLVNQVMLATLIPLSLLYFTKNSSLPFFSKNKFLIFLSVAFILRVFVIISSPHPNIDVYDQLKNGAKYLLQLKNPYQQTYPVIYPNHIPLFYGYLPSSIFIMIPFVKLLEEPRYAHILSDIGSALIFYWLLKKTSKKESAIKTQELVPLIFLYNPSSLFVIEQSWLDPVVQFFLFFFIYLYLQNKKSIIPFIVLGITLTIKETLVLIIPSLILKLNYQFKQLFFTILVCLVIILPFFFWSPKDFIQDTMTAGFNPLYNTAPIKHSLNFTGFSYQTFGRDLSNFLRISAVVPISALIFIRSKRNFLGFFYSFVIFLFTVTLFFTQAFLNYYTLINSLILLLLVFSVRSINIVNH
ncbi:hypothetical protein A2164_01565 [Candidatus Curtissbacteria bacterium RBG_13_35_7]|uniref:Glycosyltransferase RgtA/B/C/D-like domain-containing protein n=1 Tax=Candidatus Curtissbacteria bacterium RBG_13_35_7 TaxID=1797705 RepID=A0A1F5G2S6_9BACT|nr:MAG: hypothetical protein A2164_01565 [Candidatus Curtissbacteria bacterium RBG_13_35_7]